MDPNFGILAFKNSLPFTEELPLHPLVVVLLLLLLLLLFEIGCSVVWKFVRGPPYISCRPSISIGPPSRYFYSNVNVQSIRISPHFLSISIFWTPKKYLHMHFFVVLHPNSRYLNAQKRRPQPQLRAELEMAVL